MGVGQFSSVKFTIHNNYSYRANHLRAFMLLKTPKLIITLIKK